MPTLASASSGSPSITNGSWSAREIRSASRMPASGWTTSGMSSANSSPPRRATVSVGRTTAERRRASSFSIRSPQWWPSVSLTSLKRSRSMSRTATPRRGPVSVADRRPVVGVEDTAARIPELHARDAGGLQAPDRPVERDQVALAEAVLELVRSELRLERGRDQNCRLTRVRVRAPANLVLEVLREAEPEQRDREEADERERREQARPSAAGTERLPQSLTIFGTTGLQRLPRTGGTSFRRARAQVSAPARVHLRDEAGRGRVGDAIRGPCSPPTREEHCGRSSRAVRTAAERNPR